MLENKFIELVENQLTIKYSQKIRVLGINRVSGGCINKAARIRTNLGDCFLKWNSNKESGSMFDLEARGLQLLRDAKAMNVPEVIFVAQFETNEFICLEFIDKGIPENNFWVDFGKSLAVLHSNSSSEFGLSYNNYIGSLKQTNNLAKSWSEFFVSHRLEPMIKLARLSSEYNRKFNKLFHFIEAIFPKEPPSLLHGDLWSGNYMVNKEGKAAIFDPAVYFGHREMDIAMTRLFGGFPKEFYEGYNLEWPLNEGWEDRMDLCNLYPLLVHVNLFGGSYLTQIQHILNRFISL